VLQEFSAPSTAGIYALRAAGDHVPARIRVFIDVLSQRLLFQDLQ
jgi:hypothetical protein